MTMILGPLLCNIFLRDLFLLTKDVDIATYANDNTPYIVGDYIDHVISALQNATASLFEWFLDNQMKTTNPKKCYLLSLMPKDYW